MQDAVFRKESLEGFSVSAQVHEYMRASYPGLWIILGAMLALTGCGIFWACTAVIPTRIMGYALGNAGDETHRLYTAYMPPDSAETLQSGMAARVEEIPAQVVACGEIPLSRREVLALLAEERKDAQEMNDYLIYALGIGDWNVPILIQTERPLRDIKNGKPVPFIITTAQFRPLDFLRNAAFSNAHKEITP
jgi:hypothetical protein